MTTLTIQAERMVLRGPYVSPTFLPRFETGSLSSIIQELGVKTLKYLDYNLRYEGLVELKGFLFHDKQLTSFSWENQSADNLPLIIDFFKAHTTLTSLDIVNADERTLDALVDLAQTAIPLKKLELKIQPHLTPSIEKVVKILTDCQTLSSLTLTNATLSPDRMAILAAGLLPNRKHQTFKFI